jgi:hypothetical protein
MKSIENQYEALTQEQKDEFWQTRGHEWLVKFLHRIEETQLMTQEIQSKWTDREMVWERRFWLLFGTYWFTVGLMMVFGWVK